MKDTEFREKVITPLESEGGPEKLDLNLPVEQRLTPKQILFLAKVLRKGGASGNYFNLKRIILSHIDLKDEGFIAIAAAIAVLPQLVSLSLTNTGLGTKGAMALAKALTVSKSIQRVYLGDNPLYEEGAKILAEALTRRVDCPSLELDLQWCNIGDAGAVALADAIKANPQAVSDLNISHNKINETGAIALAQALTIKPNALRSLDLDGNYIGTIGIKALAEALQDPDQKLSRLLLGHICLVDAETLAISQLLKALASNIYLKILRLSENKLTNPMALELAQAFLGRHSRLERLILSKNKINDVGAAALLALLWQPNALEFVFLDENQLSEPTKKEFERTTQYKLYTSRVLAFMAATTLKNKIAASRFLKADGDNAVMTRVVEYLRP